MKTEDIIRKNRTELFKKKDVILVVPGTKIKGGIDTGKKALVVGVKQKLPLSQLAANDIVPAKIDGLITDVIEVGDVKLLAEDEPAEVDRKKRMRPALGGVSIGHYQVTAGTLGMVVRKNDKRHILSNNHVLANVNRAKAGDIILQPGSYDGGTEADKLTELSEFNYIHIEKTPGTGITLLSPNGGDSWIIGEQVTIKWQAEFQDNIRIELSQDGGISLVTIASSVPSQDGQYSWQVLPLETEKARIKVIQINSPYSSDMSDANFAIQQPKPPEPSGCKTSKVVAASVNAVSAAVGKKERLWAVVPKNGEIDGESSAAVKTLNKIWGALDRKTRFMTVPAAAEEAELNLTDSALTKEITEEEASDEILGVGIPQGAVEPEVDMRIKHSGRTTGITYGKITHVGASIKIDFREGRFAVFNDQIITDMPVAGGDSGSVLLTEDNKVTGLVFAGSNTISVANKYSNVKKAHGLD